MGARKGSDPHCLRCGADSSWISTRPKGEPSCECVEKDAEIAKLRAERDEYKDKAHSLNRDRASARDAVFKEGLARIEAEKQLAAARAALANLDWSDATGHTFMDLRRALEKAGTNPWRTDHGGADRVQVAIDCVRQLCTEIQSSRAALDGERGHADKARDLMRGLFACVHDSMTGFEEDAAGLWCQAHDERRAAEAIAIPPNRTGTPEESQAIADWHHDEISRRAAEAKASRGGEGKP